MTVPERGAAHPRVPVLRRPKMSVEVADYLRGMLLTGRYAPQTRLNPQEIAEEIGVSTMPVREALTLLTAEGLIETSPRQGYRVAGLTAADIDEVFRVHAFVAGRLARSATAHLTSDDLSSLRAIQGNIEQIVASAKSPDDAAADVESWNFRFHSVINHAADSGRLRWFYRVAARYVPRQFYVEAPGWVGITLRDHPTLLDALEARDAHQSQRTAEQHVLHARDIIVAHMQELATVEANPPGTSSREGAPRPPGPGE